MKSYRNQAIEISEALATLFSETGMIIANECVLQQVDPEAPEEVVVSLSEFEDSIVILWDKNMTVRAFLEALETVSDFIKEEHPEDTQSEVADFLI